MPRLLAATGGSLDRGRELVLGGLSSARHPLALIANGLGDHLLALPALRALAALFPSRLRLACLPGARELFFTGLPLGPVDSIQPTGSVNGVVTFEPARLAASVKCCDLFILLNRALPPCVLDFIHLIGAPRSIGLFRDLAIPVPFAAGVHAADLAFELVRAIDPGLRVDDYSAPPILPSTFVQQAREFRAMMPPDSRLLAVHNETAPAKVWPADRMRQLLDTLSMRHPELWVVVLGEDCRTDAMLPSSRALDCRGIPLEAALAFVAAADWFLGIDSCLLHAADLFRTPALGLFGPTSPAEFGIRFGPGIPISADGAMHRIASEDVLAALETLFVRHPPRVNSNGSLRPL